MKKILQEFLTHHTERPILLGLSGGPDSIALYHLLKECQVEFAVAHVDHGWRPESREEALQLQQLAQDDKIPFHLKTLDPQTLTGNLEAACRKERLLFFKELNYQAIILGHHADDLAETVLMRLLEGSSLPHLSGIHEISTIEGVTIWRPFLSLKKKEILGWLKTKKHAYFQDSTNQDPKYLRSRLRTRLLPQIQQEYQKNIEAPLCRIATESRLLNDYLAYKLQSHLDAIQVTPLGHSLQLPPDLHPYELRHLIHHFCQRAQLFPNHAQLQTAADLIQQHAANRSLQFENRHLHIDRGILFAPFSDAPASQSLKIEPGHHHFGEWELSVTKIDKPFLAPATDWQNLWKGEGTACLPEGDYKIDLPKMNAKYITNKKIADWWTDHKVPSFLRRRAPVIWDGEVILHEFLTGKNNSLKSNPLSCYAITLKPL